MEADFSPHQSWQDLKKFNNFRPGDSEELEPEEICSEHEKSDSEQEKDVATPIVEIFDKKIEENNVDVGGALGFRDDISTLCLDSQVGIILIGQVALCSSKKVGKPN